MRISEFSELSISYPCCVVLYIFFLINCKLLSIAQVVYCKIDYILSLAGYILSRRLRVNDNIYLTCQFSGGSYLVTSCIACAKYSTFLDVTPAMEMRPSLVR